jgi:hypothetical protein
MSNLRSFKSVGRAGWWAYNRRTVALAWGGLLGRRENIGGRFGSGLHGGDCA